jgi:uroporphyrinogen-III synthase
VTALLEGRRVALLEAQLADEAAACVRHFGGVPYCVPAVRQAAHLDRVVPFVDALSSGRVSVVVFMTGVGAATLLGEAARLGRLEETTAALRRTTIACRGPKPAAILNQHKVPVQIAAAEPYTTKELIEALASINVNDRLVAVVHHGEPNRPLAAALSARGAQLKELSLYEWALPDDLAPLKALVRELVDGRVDAVAFTNRIQCRHLFRVALELELTAPLTHALNAGVIVAAVGPICADALHAVGVAADVIPARPTMEAMIGALAEYVDLTRVDGEMG